MEDKYKGVIFGMAVCDAIGAAVEFQARGSYAEVEGMRGGGKFDIRPGEWTDDSSMALCLGESVVEAGWDADDQMLRFMKWYEYGHLSSYGEAFDIGKCTVKALGTWRSATSDGEKLPSPKTYYGPATDKANGNGGLMRIAPIPLAYRNDLPTAIQRGFDSSRTTHGGDDSNVACGMYTEMVITALRGEMDKEVVLCPETSLKTLDVSDNLADIITRHSYRTKTRDDIKASGWVVESLEAALWAFWHTTTFQQGALLCANLGDDTDTIAAIYGTLAGAYYGFSSIPPEWTTTVAHPTVLSLMSTALLDFSESATPSPLAWSKQLSRLESATLSLLKRIRPGPRMYRSYEQYTAHVEELKREFETLEGAPEGLVVDFVKSWERHSEKLKIRFG